MTLKPLDIDIDTKAYLALHDLPDEPAADAMLTDRELAIRVKTPDVVAREVASRATGLDAAREFAHDGVPELAAEGLCGLAFSQHVGGTGNHNVAYAVAMEEITRAMGELK